MNPKITIESHDINDIVDFHESGNLSDFEFVNLLERRWVWLKRKIESATTGNSTWEEHYAWKVERHEIDALLEKLQSATV